MIKHPATCPCVIMASEVFHDCNMCCYGTYSLEALISHVCKFHKDHPSFHVYCKTCLRSYTKWDSYRKHVQRGCKIMPTGTQELGTSDEPSEDLTADVDSDTIQPEPMDFERPHHNDVYPEKWHEALYILNLKEQFSLSQVAVDHVLASTTALVSGLLKEILDSIKDHVATDTMGLLEETTKNTVTSLFKGVSTSFLQKKYFKQHFKLLVSYPLLYDDHHALCNEYLNDNHPTILY